jgi:hypothetical protein
MNARTRRNSGRHSFARLSVKASLAAVGGVFVAAANAVPAFAVDPPAGYGYGYGYGYGAVSNFVQSGLSSGAVVTAVPAGALLIGATLWERRRSQRLLIPVEA